MRVLKVIGIFLIAAVLAIGITGTAAYFGGQDQTDQQQAALQPFYDLPDPLPAVKAGTIIRSEPMADFDSVLTDAKASRILYMSAGPDGAPRVSSGMIFVPTKPATTPSGKREVVAYAHGTSGFGDDCAPSRNPATPANMPWIQTMTDLGWVVAATDYVGLGTTGDPFYLIAQSEANDVVNSVRAARNFPGSQAGSDYVVMGHSQGGHSAIWTGELSKKIAPELVLKGVAASAPAAELTPLLTQQWNTKLAWAIGPDVLVSWPQVYPNLQIADVATQSGIDNYREFAYDCIVSAGISGDIEAAEGNLPFKANPAVEPGWADVVKEQTPRPLPASMPVMITQSAFDGVVLPNTTAKLQESWCKAGSSVQMNWLGNIASGPVGPLLNHEDTVLVGWPAETNWIQQRFRGDPPTPNCTVTPTVAPAK